MLKMTQGQLSEATGISSVTISFLLSGKGDREPKASTRQKVVDYLRLQGIEFIDGGVRKKPAIIELEGTEGFRSFMDDVYETVKCGGEICLYNTEPEYWIRYLGAEWYSAHNARMSKIENLKVRNAIREGNKNYILDCCDYRWVPKDKWKNITFYAYGDKLGLLDFGDDKIRVSLIQQKKLAESFKVLFESVWRHETIEALGAKRGGTP